MATSSSRFGKFLKSSVGALLQPAEDPRKSGSTPDEEQQMLLAQVRQAAGRLAGTRERLQHQRAATAESAAAMDDQARNALRTGQEEIARIALQRQRQGFAELGQLDRQIASLFREEDRLATIAQRITTQIESMRSREQLAAARHSAAQAQVAAGEALTGFGPIAGDIGMIEQIEREAEAMEARAEAIEELTTAGILGVAGGHFSRSEVTAAVGRSDEEIEQRLQQLKIELQSV